MADEWLAIIQELVSGDVVTVSQISLAKAFGITKNALSSRITRGYNPSESELLLLREMLYHIRAARRAVSAQDARIIEDSVRNSPYARRSTTK